MTKQELQDKIDNLEEELQRLQDDYDSLDEAYGELEDENYRLSVKGAECDIIRDLYNFKFYLKDAGLYTQEFEAFLEQYLLLYND